MSVATAEENAPVLLQAARNIVVNTNMLRRTTAISSSDGFHDTA